MPEEKTTKKRGTLKVFTFTIGSGKWEGGVIVVVDYKLKAAQKKAFASFGESSIFGISSPESFTSYTIHLVKPGVVASLNYAI